jgi:hypothetical protein
MFFLAADFVFQVRFKMLRRKNGGQVAHKIKKGSGLRTFVCIGDSLRQSARPETVDIENILFAQRHNRTESPFRHDHEDVRARLGVADFQRGRHGLGASAINDDVKMRFAFGRYGRGSQQDQQQSQRFVQNAIPPTL